jgi:hypothetical protein
MEATGATIESSDSERTDEETAMNKEQQNSEILENDNEEESSVNSETSPEFAEPCESQEPSEPNEPSQSGGNVDASDSNAFDTDAFAEDLFAEDGAVEHGAKSAAVGVSEHSSSQSASSVNSEASPEFAEPCESQEPSQSGGNVDASDSNAFDTDAFVLGGEADTEGLGLVSGEECMSNEDMLEAISDAEDVSVVILDNHKYTSSGLLCHDGVNGDPHSPSQGIGEGLAQSMLSSLFHNHGQHSFDKSNSDSLGSSTFVKMGKTTATIGLQSDLQSNLGKDTSSQDKTVATSVKDGKRPSDWFLEEASETLETQTQDEGGLFEPSDLPIIQGVHDGNHTNLQIDCGESKQPDQLKDNLISSVDEEEVIERLQEKGETFSHNDLSDGSVSSDESRSSNGGNSDLSDEENFDESSSDSMSDFLGTVHEVSSSQEQSMSWTNQGSEKIFLQSALDASINQMSAKAIVNDAWDDSDTMDEIQELVLKIAPDEVSYG